MTGVKTTLIVLAILLFISNYSICDYFYYNNEVHDLKRWWGLKSNLYAIIIALVFQSYVINSKRWLRFFLQIGTGFAISNVVDKVFWNVLEFRKNDIIMIVLTFAFACWDYTKEKKKC